MIVPDESTDHPLDIAILYPPPTDQTTLKSLKTFLRSVVHSFDAISRETHYSFTVFSEKTSSPLLFNGLEGRKYTKENVNKMIDKIQKDSSVARVDRGIQYADQEIFTLINGMRTAAHKVSHYALSKCFYYVTDSTGFGIFLTSAEGIFAGFMSFFLT